MAKRWPKIITRCEREITEMKAAQLLAPDGVQVFRVKLEAAIDKRNVSQRRFKIVTRRNQYVSVSGMVFKLMVGRRSSFTGSDGRCHSSFPASAK